MLFFTKYLIIRQYIILKFKKKDKLVLCLGEK